MKIPVPTKTLGTNADPGRNELTNSLAVPDPSKMQTDNKKANARNFSKYFIIYLLMLYKMILSFILLNPKLLTSFVFYLQLEIL